MMDFKYNAGPFIEREILFDGTTADEHGQAWAKYRAGATFRISTNPPEVHDRVLRETEKNWGRRAIEITTMDDQVAGVRAYVKGDHPL